MSVFSQNLNWIKQIQGTGTDFINATTTDAAGNIYAVGIFTGTIDFDPGVGIVNATAFGSDIWFGKYNSTGDLIWAKALTGGGNDHGRDIVIDVNGNIYITGNYETQTPLDFDPGAGTAAPVHQQGIFMAKYNNTGAFQWLKTIGGINGVGNRLTANAIAINAPGAAQTILIGGDIAGSTNVTFDFDPGAGTLNLSSSNGKVFYARYTNSGNVIWAKNVGPGNSNAAILKDLAVDNSDNTYITGFFSGVADFHPSSTSPTLNSSSGSSFVCKYNPNGNYLWTSQVSGTSGDMGNAITTDASGNVFVTGARGVSGGNAFLSKFTSAGTQSLLLNIGGPSSDMGQSLRVDGSGNLYMAGFFAGNSVDFNPLQFGNPKILSTSFIDFFIAKYSTSNLNCLWARNYDLNIFIPNQAIKSLHLINGKIVATGHFRGSGDFTTCGSSTMFNAPNNDDGFMVGYNITDPAVSILGPDEICSPGQLNFSINNPPIGTTVTWSVSPTNLVSPSTGSGANFSTNLLPGFGPGQLVVTATISGPCGQNVQHIVTIGAPQSACEPSIVLEPCATLQATTCSGATTYNWFIDGNNVLTSDLHFVDISLITNQLAAGNHTLCVNTENTCGTTEQVCTPFYTWDCGGGQNAMAYPNPAQGTFNIVIDATKTSEELSFDYSFRFLDKAGVMVLSGTSRKNTLSIDVSALPKDTYYFKLSLPKQLVEQRIVIN